MLCVASSEPHQVGRSVLKMLLPGFFPCIAFSLWFPKGLDLLWGCGSVLKLLLCSLGPVGPESLPCACKHPCI